MNWDLAKGEFMKTQLLRLILAISLISSMWSIPAASASVIYCKKGLSTATISGLSPKCPTGFVKTNVAATQPQPVKSTKAKKTTPKITCTSDDLANLVFYANKVPTANSLIQNYLADKEAYLNQARQDMATGNYLNANLDRQQAAGAQADAQGIVNTMENFKKLFDLLAAKCPNAGIEWQGVMSAS